MKLIAPLLFSILTLLASCNRQTKNSASNVDTASKRSTPGETVNKLGKHLWYVFQDSKNNYSFSSNTEGVYRYDGKTIVNFTKKDGLSSDTIRQIQEDKLGNIYVTTFGAIHKFDGQTFTTLQPIKSKDWKLGENDLWFNVLGKRGEHGPYRYDGEKLYNLEFPKHFLHDEITERGMNPFFSPYEVYCIYKDRKGAMWFGTSVFGACRFDGQSIKWMYEEDLTIVPTNGGTFRRIAQFLKIEMVAFGSVTPGTSIFSILKKPRKVTDSSTSNPKASEMPRFWRRGVHLLLPHCRG